MDTNMLLDLFSKERYPVIRPELMISAFLPKPNQLFFLQVLVHLSIGNPNQYLDDPVLLRSTDLGARPSHQNSYLLRHILDHQYRRHESMSILSAKLLPIDINLEQLTCPFSAEAAISC